MTQHFPIRVRMAAILAVLGLAALNPAPASAVIPSGNLLANPGAEAGPGAQGLETVPPPGWTTSGPFTAVQYGASSFPSTAISAGIGGGANFFAGGEGSPIGSGSQTIDLSAAAPEIDANGVEATVSAFLGGYLSQEDYAVITVTFMDSGGSLSGGFAAGPVTAADRGNATGFQARSTTGPVPPGTRSAVVMVTAARDSGTYNDGYADNASLTLAAAQGPPPPPPAPEQGETVRVGLVSGTVLVREPGASEFRDLQGLITIPVGSSVNATDGVVRLGAETESGAEQVSDFFDGQFRVDQGTGDDLTTMTLEGPKPGSCKKGKGRSRRAKGSSRELQRLWGKGGGKTRTKGHRGSGTVRGTLWLTVNRCDGTLFKVKEGVVEVRDFTRKKTVKVRAGEKYLAAAP